MNCSPYTKKIPPFYQSLLNQLNKVEILALNELTPPNQQIHYYPSKDSIRIYTSTVIKVSHELAHMLEVTDNSRLLSFDYGIRKYFPTTHKGQLQAIAREARTRGIQSRLIETAFGHCQLLYHRFANILINPAGKIGKFESDAEVLEWSNSIVRSSYNAWSADRIVAEWKPKAEFINHWLETRGPDQDEHAQLLEQYRINDQWFSCTRISQKP